MSVSRPRVLFVAPLIPHPPPLFGGQMRIDQLVRALSSEFDVEFAAPSLTATVPDIGDWAHASGVSSHHLAPWDEFHPGVDPIWGTPLAMLKSLLPTPVPAAARMRWSRALVVRLRTVLANGRFDVVWASRILAAEMARAAGAKRILVDIDDFEAPLLQARIHAALPYRRAPFHRLQADRLVRYERHLARRFSAVAVTKSGDLAMMDGGAADRWVIPNGVNVPADVPCAPADTPTLLFVGALTYDPNQDAVQWFAEEILPHVRARVHGVRVIVAGRGPVETSWIERLRSHGIEVIESPLTLEPLYAAAHVAIVPLRRGGGTSIKTLEAMSFGRAVVSTAAGVRGLDVVPGTHAMVSDEPVGFAQACIDLLTNRAAAAEMGATSRRLVSEGHTWTQSGEVARAAVAQLSAAGGSPMNSRA